VIIHPFNALRPKKDLYRKVTSVPYDVIDSDEARALAEDLPYSFLHVIRPEIDFGADVDIHDDRIYEKGASNLNKLIEDGVFELEGESCVYVYRLEMLGQTQTGVFTCVSVDEYDQGLIRKHEMTRPDKEDDRTRHILTQKAHAEPVMLAHQPDRQVAGLIHECTAETPIYDFTTEDGVKHTIWKSDHTEEWVLAFKRIEMFYVADGHHRCKAASRAAEELRKDQDEIGEAAYFPAVLFSTDQMQIMAYNRAVFHVEDAQLEKFLDDFEALDYDAEFPTSKGKVCVYVDGKWHTIRLQLPTTRHDAVENLDASQLQKQILERYFGIGDPRTDKNISFIGGIRGTAELKKIVDSGRARIAFSMYPTSIDELIEVSDQNKLMPPKSTWFEPKLRSGFLVHCF
jgi:uncharacterized protein (DUF1015 family)